jgi:ribonuclease VapC
MVIDSSAIVALLLGEPETEALVAAIAAAQRRVVSAGSYLESAIVISARSGSTAQAQLDELLDSLGIAILPFTREQADTTIEAYRRYGKGSGHPANLNFGDCFAYPLAKLTDEPILFKGNDFSQTDLRPAVPRA